MRQGELIYTLQNPPCGSLLTSLSGAAKRSLSGIQFQFQDTISERQGVQLPRKLRLRSVTARPMSKQLSKKDWISMYLAKDSPFSLTPTMIYLKRLQNSEPPEKFGQN